MSPQTKRRTVNGVLITLAIPAAFTVAWKSLGYAAGIVVTHEVTRAVDHAASNYVRDSAFRAYKDSVHTRAHDDSVVRDFRERARDERIARIDSNVVCLRYRTRCQ